MNRDAIETQLGLMEVAETALGWDRPARFLLVSGSADEPQIISTEIKGEDYPHPGMYLESLVEGKVVLPETVLGAGMLFEGYRHLTYEEAVKTPGHLVHNMWHKAIEEKDKPDTPQPPEGETFEEALEPALKKVWEKYSQLIGPSDMADDQRRECRNASIMFRNGDQIFMGRERDGDREFFWSDDWRSKPKGAVQEAMAQLLDGPQ